MRFDIINKSIAWMVIAVVLVGFSVFMFFKNMTLSIQFTGGVEVQVLSDTSTDVLQTQISEYMKSKDYGDFDVGVGTKDGYTDILLKIPVDDDEMVSTLSDDIQAFLIDNNYVKNSADILEISIIGPSVGAYMKQKAVQAITVGVIFMAIYILFAFSGMRVFINPALLAIVTIITMIFDISLPSGAYGFLMSINPTIQVDSIFIIALLTVMGYSINDTIVIFDRIRENFQNNQGKVKDGRTTYKEIFESSLWQTMRRSLGTSGSTLLVVVTMYFLGTGILKQFEFTLGIGVIAGTYSSIFLAAPLAYLLSGKYKKEKEEGPKKKK